jgi:signal transduction histidine kinase
MQLVRELTDSGMLLLLCLIAAFAFFPDTLLVTPLLVTAAILAFQLYTERKALQLGLQLLFAALCFPFPLLCLFAPVLVYSSCRTGHWRWLVLLLLPGYYSFAYLGLITLLFSAAVCGLAVLLQRRSLTVQKLLSRYFSLQDESRILHGRLESRQQQLLEQQDTEIHLATMNERNRIARDIHDNVGHLLSSALLQTAALKTAATAAAATATAATTKGPSSDDSRLLDQLQATLNQAMSSVRESVHQLHETSVSLEHYLQRLIDEFSFCKAFCSIDIYSEPGKEHRYSILSIVKEALSNIMKHSEASELVLRLREHPGFYQLLIENDGVMAESGSRGRVQFDDMLNRGIGLRNMQERVESLGGQFRLDVDKRFRLFITLPKNLPKNLPKTITKKGET